MDTKKLQPETVITVLKSDGHIDYAYMLTENAVKPGAMIAECNKRFGSDGWTRFEWAYFTAFLQIPQDYGGVFFA